MTTPRVQQEEKPKDALRSGIVKYEFSKNYLYNMKYEQGELTEEGIKGPLSVLEQEGAFWNPYKEGARKTFQENAGSIILN